MSKIATSNAMERVPPPAVITYRLTVELKRSDDGPVVERETVLDSDVICQQREAWLSLELRKGRPEAPFVPGHFRLGPVYLKDRRPYCAGFLLELVAGNGGADSSVFARSSLDPVAERAALRMIAAGSLRKDEEYFYELKAEALEGSALETSPEDPQGPRQELEKCGITAGEVQMKPLPYQRVPLDRILARAENRGHQDGDSRPIVFFTRRALEKSERISRSGEKREPPVENGCVLVGTLCSCPTTGEMFCVVSDAIEAREADQEKFALTFTGKTWARIQAVLKARRRSRASRSELLIGVAHCHPFLPLGGAKPCDECMHVNECRRTTAFHSSDDVTWLRAVFHGQPWHLSQVFGFNARGEPVSALYGLHQGLLQKRGFHLLPDFSGDSGE